MMDQEREPGRVRKAIGTRSGASPRGKHKPGRSWLGVGWLAAWSVLGCLVLLSGIGPFRWSTRTPQPAGPVVQPVAGAAAAGPSAGTWLKPIEAIRVGERVLAGNPERAGRTGDWAEGVNPATWRRIQLVLPRPGGGDIHIVLLRPVSWLRVHRAAVGRAIALSMPEMRVEGPAWVVSIDPCPPLRPGAGRVVTGTFTHAGAPVLDLHVAGQAEPLGVTPWHRFYSLDRKAFVPADQLRVGERLKPEGGATRVVAVEPRPGKFRVYNLEVENDHIFHVSSLGILVHNEYPVTVRARASIT